MRMELDHGTTARASTVKKGYYADDLVDSWHRYVDARPDSRRALHAQQTVVAQRLRCIDRSGTSDVSPGSSCATVLRIASNWRRLPRPCVTHRI